MTQGKNYPDEQRKLLTQEELWQVVVSMRSSRVIDASSATLSPSVREVLAVEEGSLERHMQSALKVPSRQEMHDALRRMQADTEFRENWVETLEKRAGVEKRLRKFRPPDPVEPGVAKWLAVPIAQIFLSEDQREEWLGDLREENRKLMRDGYPTWMLNLINIGKIARLFKSSLAIKIVDLILKLRGKA